MSNKTTRAIQNRPRTEQTDSPLRTALGALSIGRSNAAYRLAHRAPCPPRGTFWNTRCSKGGLPGASGRGASWVGDGLFWGRRRRGPFWCPTREEIAPYLFNGAVECWLGGDTQTPAEKRTAARSNFWRIHPEGMAFLLCGFLEDGIKMLSEGHSPNLPGTVFDIILPVWRIGEALLQAQRLARNLFEGPTTIRFIATYSGLSGRALVSIDQRRRVWETHIARQDSITLSTHVDAMAIDTNLPEIVHPLLSPLYALFDFFELSDQFVAEELSHMRGGKY